MFKFLVFLTIVAVAVAKPSGHGAVSHQSRTDYISKPIITGYAAPLISESVVSTPVVAPVVHAQPVAVTHHAAPIVSELAAPIISNSFVSSPVVSSYSAVPAIEHLGYHTSNLGYHTGNIGYHTGDLGYSTGNLGYSNGHLGYYAGNLGYSTGHLGYSTDHLGHSYGGLGYSSGLEQVW